MNQQDRQAASSPGLFTIYQESNQRELEGWMASSTPSSASSWASVRMRRWPTTVSAQSTRPSTMGGSSINVKQDSVRTISNDANSSYGLNDQRWSLQRRKIGLPRTPLTASQRFVSKQTVINLAFIRKHFHRKECVRYVRNPKAFKEGSCYCGLLEKEHIPPALLLAPPTPPATSESNGILTRVLEDLQEEKPGFGTMFLNALNFNFVSRQVFAPIRLSSVSPQSATPPDPTQNVEVGFSEEDGPVRQVLEANGVTPRYHSNSFPTSPPHPANMEDRLVLPPVRSSWRRSSHLREFPTNAYGVITVANETAGSTKPSKYVRLSCDTPMQSVLTLLSDYWQLLDPHRPQLVISVTGGAKNFQLDGKKKETFSSGLIKVGITERKTLLAAMLGQTQLAMLGQAVNKGQYIVKVKQRTLFKEEHEHMVRGIRCLGVVPWGYISNRDQLINTDPNQFASVRYKVEEKVNRFEPVPLNGDHTHFLLVDDGTRNSFSGVDSFRTRLEEAIQAGEPHGLGVPVVLLLLEGGLNSIIKCSMALKRNIPILVVAGTGRAADLLAYAASMTIHTPSGQYNMRKGHRAQLLSRISVTMEEFQPYPDKQEKCADLLIECCTKVNMITIFDINCDEAMDKYILYALLTGEMQTTRLGLDQLGLALLWDRPDIAETHIFPAQKNWPSGALEDLMTTALLEEKVEFIKLFVVNGLVMADYLTVAKLRHLYNKACESNTHLTEMLERRRPHADLHHLSHVHRLLVTMMHRHHQPAYQADTPEASTDNPSVNYLTFEDPYLELLVWCILSGRGKLARHVWRRCNSPLCATLVASCLYRSLWRSLGATMTDLRHQYHRYKDDFEHLAVDLLAICFEEDVVNAMSLLEQRNVRWGEVDCLELAFMANDMNFISTPAAQACINLNWQRGMSRAPFYAVIVANICPLLIFWRRLFCFQKLGDNGGDLTACQKLCVFYKSPISKFYAHSTAFVVFLALYAYVVLFDLRYEMSVTEMVLVVWIMVFIMEEVWEIACKHSLTVWGKVVEWTGSVWNRFDVVSLLLALVALGLRLHRATFKWGRITYALNTTVFYCRLLRMYHVNYHLGPKLVIFYRMISEVLVFMALLVIFILGYGIASQSLLHLTRDALSLNTTAVSMIMKDIFLIPYWQMYGELQLEEIKGEDVEMCHPQSCQEWHRCEAGGSSPCQPVRECLCENPRDYSWVVYLMLFFYLIIGNIMLLNLLIAIFTYVFDEVQENSMEIWKFEMFSLLHEYDSKPALMPPLCNLVINEVTKSVSRPL
ncbi:transient receptor potential cation channel subfamily M member-like 2 [Panulirus ornatus]|uniref:transient receptor potential cation channel subfamily M member-like 2 n=1 Tax=Panulirus ornatus TaxID=150431 RepID=UPI003A87671A